MNNHLLPFPYNQSRPPTWKGRLLHPFFHALLPSDGSQRSTPLRPSSTISTQLLSNEAANFRPIRIICISDTHNTTPVLPPGDILIHSGDLTARGTFDEVQAQLRWLHSQPHPHKIVIGGNHDLLLDEACDDRFPTRGDLDAEEKRAMLDWGGIVYLQDEAVNLEVAIQAPSSSTEGPQSVTRKVKIYGSPLTPEFGQWAFQYPAIRDVWTGRIPDGIDILAVHGPPALYGDNDGEQGPSEKVKVKGDGYLLREIRRTQPKTVVCGHIHGAYGVATIEHNGIQDIMDEQQMRWPGHDSFNSLKRIIQSKRTLSGHTACSRQTLVVNAAIAPAALKNDDKPAIAIDVR
ncbi:metallophosphatase domain-containing protein [Aspergillus stella-maris]|uniref:metallophosphatase domain-containing protein n=1 Tax=Aspergillus stella-maris TaxID=1810926 RepID=UPI003CCD588F